MPTEQELLQALQRNVDGTAAIASTARAARSLRQCYDLQQQSVGNRGWRTPRILAWEPWLKTMWDAAILCGVDSRLLLNAAQETELWRQALARDESAAQTMSIAGLAVQAQQASEAMHRYQIDLRDVGSDSSIDSQAFSRWAAEVEKICRQHSLVPSSQAETALAPAVRAGKLRLPETIFLVGFDRVTPSQNILIEALRAQGCDARFVELAAPVGQTARQPAIVYARTLDEEIGAAAHWIRTKLFEGQDRRIGVIVPALGEVRGRIDAAFRRALAPSTMDVHVSAGKLPYEFSLGTPVHRAQEIRTALALLEWPLTALKPAEVSWLTVHGAFSSGSSDARAMLDKQFRERDFQLGGPVSFFAFRQWLTDSGGQSGTLLRRSLDRVAVAAKRLDMTKSRSYSEWREAMEEMLAASDWSLLTAKKSAEYQLLRRWNALLNELVSLSVVAGPVQYSDALDRVKSIAATMLFTLESKNAPVQILGASEAAGLTFDSIWWMNAHASRWPLRGHAQPFLPWSVQRAAHMPYADPAEDAAFSLRATSRILSSANNAIVSFALQESDATTESAHVSSPQIAMSPLVRKALPDAPMLAVEAFLADEFHLRSKFEARAVSSALETVAEEVAVPFQGNHVRSGVTFLKQQAACPFRAFAEFRLAAEPIAVQENGLSAAAQGTVLHQVLQNFWNEMQSRKKLRESSEEQIRLILRGHIQSALRRFSDHADEPWQQALLEIEADRVEARLLEWLEVEKRRPDFTVLKTEETLEHMHLGGIDLRCRIDRLDRVEQGIVLMDYKTGTVKRNACEGERPDEPQLPAYALLKQVSATKESPLAGVAFAGLHPRNVGFTVVASLPEIFPASSGAPKNQRASLSPDGMLRQQEDWKATLTRLAEDFRAGTAAVDPKHRDETCRYCAQALLCRIREIDTATGEEDLDEAVGANDLPDFES